jgi:hypothetical protein
MTNTTHTHGRIEATSNGLHSGMYCVALTHMEPREQRVADARRIAACWNACQGIDTEKLEALTKVAGVDVPVGLARFNYQLTASTGYEAEGTHPGITAEQYGRIVAAMHNDWRPLTHASLRSIEQEAGKQLWLYAPSLHQEPVVGIYVWQQGPSPGGFNTEHGARIAAADVTHTMAFIVPGAPT